MVTDGEPGALDAADEAILRALLRTGGAYLTVLDLRQLTALGVRDLTARVPHLERLGYIWRLPDGTTGLHCSYHLSAAGVAAARLHPVGAA